MCTDSTGTMPQWLGWLFTGIILVGLAVATVLTFGAAAPITGLAATMVVGAMIGASVGVAVSIVSQGLVNGWDNINSWQVFTDMAVGAIGGAISGVASTTTSVELRIGLKGARIALGGIGAAVNGIIEGKSFGEIMASVAISIGVGTLVQGAMSALDKITGKLTTSVLEALKIDGVFKFGIKQMVISGVLVAMKTAWKYVKTSTVGFFKNTIFG